MGREILFKAQRADTKEWVEGYPVFDFANCSLKRRGKCACKHSGQLLCFYGWIDELHEYGEIEVIPETVCQYTGLNDGTKWEELSEEEKEKFLSKRNHKEDRMNAKEDWNGRKIFEGDIVKGVAYSTDFVGYIVWIDAIAGFGVRYFNKHREPTAWENSSILKAIQRWKQPNEFQAEVIGNIFDNPELLNQ